MSAALAEPLVTVTTRSASPSAVRAEASRANGRLSHGPTSPEGKARSRQNGCKDGLTGAGIVLPPDAAAEVARREAEYVATLRPRDVVERELVRQMALAGWRGHELGIRIVRHDVRMNAARFVNWDQDQKLAAAELGQRLGESPEAIVVQLEQTSAGCDWLIGRWTLLGNGLKTAADGGPACVWTDADMALVLNLLGRPPELRHLDDWTGQLQSLRARASSGLEEAVAELRAIIAEQVADLEHRRDLTWEIIEQRRLEDLRSGVLIDLGPEGTRLRRYEAAADRLFRSAWNKLERLRKERDEPFIPHSERRFVPEQTARPLSPAVPRPAPVPPAASPAPAAAPPRPAPVVPSAMRLDEPPTVLDFWAAGPPRDQARLNFPVQNEPDARPAREKRTSPQPQQPCAASPSSGWISRSDPMASRQT